ncbi:hypothetical protein LCGC14_1805310 [marine sediment metagenome]|uniref:Uncharacterized protein n=1 Tax=marine sediment metagenome TaxID=412755 RepID=A0A0F9GNI8_9ZZZZ
MKRIRVDLAFEEDIEADEVWTAMKNYFQNKKIINQVNEISFIDIHDCGHSTGQPCVPIERLEK